jgi:hypothetical protein
MRAAGDGALLLILAQIQGTGFVCDQLNRTQVSDTPLVPVAPTGSEADAQSARRGVAQQKLRSERRVGRQGQRWIGVCQGHHRGHVLAICDIGGRAAVKGLDDRGIARGLVIHDMGYLYEAAVGVERQPQAAECTLDLAGSKKFAHIQLGGLGGPERQLLL